MKHHEQKQLMEGIVYFILQLSGQIPSLKEVGIGIQVRNLKAETDTEIMKECYLLFISYSTCFLLASRTMNPKLVPPTVSWVLLYQSIINQDNESRLS